MASDATASRSGAQQHAPSEEAAGEDRVDDRGAAVRFHVAAGTYEHMIYGVEFCVEPDEEGRIVEELEVDKRFSYEPHGGTLTALGATGKLLVSGSADELLKVYDTRRMVEVGTLMLHEGTVTAIDFYGDTHMLSGSEDGGVCIWDVRTWDNLKVMKGHQGRVNDVAIHSSGRLAVSVGHDRTLRTWNLLKGRAAFTSARRTAAQLVAWTLCGQSVILAEEKAIQVLPLSQGGPQCSIEAGFYVSDMKLLRGDRLAVVGNHSDIHLFDVAGNGELLTLIAGHLTPRVKCLASSPALGVTGDELLVSADSSGTLKFWAVGPYTAEEFGEVKMGGRVTCLAIALPDHRPATPKARKRKKKSTKAAPLGGMQDGDRAAAASGKREKQRITTKKGTADQQRGASGDAVIAAEAGKEAKPASAIRERKRRRRSKATDEAPGDVTSTSTEPVMESNRKPGRAAEPKKRANKAPSGDGADFEVVPAAHIATSAHRTEGLPEVPATAPRSKGVAPAASGANAGHGGGSGGGKPGGKQKRAAKLTVGMRVDRELLSGKVARAGKVKTGRSSKR